MKRIFLPVFSLVIMLASCVKDKYDFSEGDATLSPTIAAPLLTASIVADDILSSVDSTMLRENGDKLLEFLYSDTVYSLELSEFIEIEDENVNYEFQLSPLTIENVDPVLTAIRLDTVAERTGSLPVDLSLLNDGNRCDFAFPEFPQSNAGNIDLEFSDAPFTTATFSNGILRLELENKWPTEIANIEISLVSDGIAIDTLRFASIPPNTTLADSVDLSGKTIEATMVGEIISLYSPGTGSDKVCIYGSDSILATFSGSDFVIVSGTAVFPDQEVVNDTINVDVELGQGEKLETLVLNDGQLGVSLNYQIKESAKLYIELPFATKNGDSFIDSLIIPAGPTTVSSNFDLSNYSFDLTKGGQGYNAIETVVRANVISSDLPVPFDTSDIVIADLSILNIDPQFIDGYFGNQVITMDNDTQTFDIGDADVFENMSFAEPEITLGFHSTFGIPMEISSLNLKMIKEGSEELLTSDAGVIPFDIVKSDILSPGTAVTSNLVLDHNSTNIAALINLWPNEVITGFTGSINADGENYNYALDTSKVDVTLDLTIPVYGTISNFNITDTIEVDSSMAEIFENVVSASLRSNVDNGFPLEANVRFYIVDENYIILDSLDVADNGDQNIIAAATVDPATGDVTQNGFRRSDLVADSEDILHLQTAGNKIIISATMNTANSGNDVKIYSNYEMDIKLGLLAKLNVSLNSDEDEEGNE